MVRKFGEELQLQLLQLAFWFWLGLSLWLWFELFFWYTSSKESMLPWLAIGYRVFFQNYSLYQG
jgi:hypothetical protein